VEDEAQGVGAGGDGNIGVGGEQMEQILVRVRDMR